MRLLIAAKDYSSAIAETGYILKEDEDDLEALLLRGRAYYYLADHDIAIRCVTASETNSLPPSFECMEAIGLG